jgi:ribonuclease HI
MINNKKRRWKKPPTTLQLIADVSAKDPFLNKTHTVVDSNKKGVSVTVHCDASVKGHLNTHDGRSFGGYGYLIVGKSHTRTSEWTRFGGMPNASPDEAEMFAILKALSEIRFPANVTVITDSANCVDKITNMSNSLDHLDRIEKKHPKERTSRDWANFAPLKILQRIHNLLEDQGNILSLDVRWVRSHTLDEIGELPSVNDIEDPDEKEHLSWRLGNHQADILANEGAKKAVRNAVWKFRHLEESQGNLGSNYDRDVARHTSMCRKNFMYSRFVRDVAVDFLSQRLDFIKKDILESILPDSDVATVLESWKEIERERNPFSVTRDENNKTIKQSYEEPLFNY